MSVLHAYFTLRKQRGFQRALEQCKGSGQSQSQSQSACQHQHQLTTSGGGGGSRSWTQRHSPLTGYTSASPGSVNVLDVNVRDAFGRTVLHAACSSVDPASLEFVRLLLAHPAINPNAQDQESHWTPLHRALYAGNIAAALLLLQRADVDMFIKDYEGYTAFDVYNSTVDGTKPLPDRHPRDPIDSSIARVPTDLFTWGTNRNASLGLGDANDRTHPDQVVLRPLGSTDPRQERPNLDDLRPVQVLGVEMSKLHTTVITAELKSNVRSCGFSSGGRLGPATASASHSQYALLPSQVGALPHQVVSVALGQDHTLALTSSGEVFSWGLNRFGQLGYILEGKAAGEEPLQASARRVLGSLRSAIVIGVAASKSASACWTTTNLYTWGTNGGQFCYDKPGQIQVLPRVVSPVAQPVAGVAMTDTTTLVLLKTGDVLCLYDGMSWRLPFTTGKRATDRYQPPGKAKKDIRKVTACEGSVGSFALLSSAGDVYLYNTEDAKKDRDGTMKKPVPQLVWAVRKQFTAVEDVALGADGSIILCTASGHVFVRIRAAKGPSTAVSLTTPLKNVPTFKFQRVLYLQRVVRVCANSTGAYAALRIDANVEPIAIAGNDMGADLANVRPWIIPVKKTDQSERWVRVVDEGDAPTDKELDALEQTEPLLNKLEEDDNHGDEDIRGDVATAFELCRLILWLRGRKDGDIPESYYRAHGADAVIFIGSISVPVHRTIIAARCTALVGVFSGQPIKRPAAAGCPAITISSMNDESSFQHCLHVHGLTLLTVLVLIDYLYTDKIVAVWDRRIALAISDRYNSLALDLQRVHQELRVLATPECLNLPSLAAAVAVWGKRAPAPTLVTDTTRLFVSSQVYIDVPRPGRLELSPQPDVILLLAGGKRTLAHSVILRARSPFFAGLLDDEEWTTHRRGPDGKDPLEVHLEHLEWKYMSYVLEYLCMGKELDVFHHLDFIQSTDQLLDFIFGIIACSNELLLDKLTLLCSSIIQRHVTIANVCAVLVDATYFNATSLMRNLQGYIAKNLETLMESRLLDDLPYDVIKALSAYIRTQQTLKAPFVRNSGNLDVLMARWSAWFEMQDIPTTIIPRTGPLPIRAVQNKPSPPIPGLSPPSNPGPVTPTKTSALSTVPHHPLTASSPIMASLKRKPSAVRDPDDGVFAMDDDPPAPIVQPTIIPSDAARPSPWKSKTAERVDMKTIIALAEEEQRSRVLARRGDADASDSSPSKWVVNRGQQQREKGRPSVGSSIETSASGRHGTAENLVKNGVSSVPIKPHALLPVARDAVTKPTDSPWRSSEPQTRPQRSSGSSAFPALSEKTPALEQKRSNMNQAGSNQGPLFTPTKSSSSSTIKRRTSSDGPAWSTPSPIVPAPSTSKVSAPLSFAAIQEMQENQGQAQQQKPVKSLKEIQEEEQEIAFLMWFEEESARVQEENERRVTLALNATDESEGSVRARGKGVRGRGRGSRSERGRGRGRREQASAAAV